MGAVRGYPADQAPAVSRALEPVHHVKMYLQPARIPPAPFKVAMMGKVLTGSEHDAVCRAGILPRSPT